MKERNFCLSTWRAFEIGAIQSQVINILWGNSTLNSDINAEPGGKKTKMITIVTKTISDIFHRPVLYLKKHDISETEFCLRLQVKSTQMGQVGRDRLRVRTIIMSMWLRWPWL
jgi:hypothetical protein